MALLGGINMTFLQLLGLVCPLAALAGAIISGLVLSMGDRNTKWKSKLGRWGAAGIVLLAFGMWGWISSIAYVN
jgi:hypothetical protein